MMSQHRGTVSLLLNGSPRQADVSAPTQTLLQWLRDDCRLTGTKEGCAEGDCGACTVVVGEMVDGQVQTRAVNACIQFMPSLQGKAVFTVESLHQGSPAAPSLHPVQQSMVDVHASQCGFCTPGFVMSLWGLYLDHAQQGTRPDRKDVVDALTGNLCRCTGYRPIIEAGLRMMDAPLQDLDRDALIASLNSLPAKPCTSATGCASQVAGYWAPESVAELVQLKAEHPDATVLAGATDIGLWVTKQLKVLPKLLDVTRVAGMTEVRRLADGGLSIGAAVRLEPAFAALHADYPEVREIWERFASRPVRNAGTLGGNVANGSPIGDAPPLLIALGATLVLASVRGERRLPIEDFYTGYMQKAWDKDEVLVAIEVPARRPGQFVRAYKVSKRFDSDISAVCLAISSDLAADQTLHAVRLGVGGMAAIPARARQTEAVLDASAPSDAVSEAAVASLAAEFSPLTDMRASADYRRQVLGHLMLRALLEARALATGGSPAALRLQEVV